MDKKLSINFLKKSFHKGKSHPSFIPSQAQGPLSSHGKEPRELNCWIHGPSSTEQEKILSVPPQKHNIRYGSPLYTRTWFKVHWSFSSFLFESIPPDFPWKLRAHIGDADVNVCFSTEVSFGKCWHCLQEHATAQQTSLCKPQAKLNSLEQPKERSL